MYYNKEKQPPLGERCFGGKLAKKTHKSIDQLSRHDPDVEVSKTPTNILLVSNSSILCGVSLEELESIFRPFDENCEFVVFPNKRSYSFVKCSTTDQAVQIVQELNGLIHPLLKTSHQPFIISYVKNLPMSKKQEDFRPADLDVKDEYVNAEFEERLVEFLTSHEKLASMKNRAVLHFGHEFDYSSNAAFKETEKIPQIMEQFIDKLITDGLITERPDQITANIYEQGNGIPFHYDTHSAFDDPIISLSLLSDVVMEFKDGANSARIAPVLLPRRSLCLIQGESRYRWKHGIISRKHDIDPRTNLVLQRQKRISLTFRKIRTKPCECAWKEFCDWDRKGEMGVPESSHEAARLESSYVADVYENIASHFDETRHSNWKAVQKFIDDLPRGALLYDVGCGNGKYLIAEDGLLKIGCDMCSGLCSIAQSKKCHVLRADALALPFKNDSADAVICIAVLHHIATLERRKLLIEEILRVLRPQGTVCITVWSMDQSSSEYERMRSNKDEMHSSTDKNESNRLKVHDGKQFEQQDVLVPWQIDQEQTFLRYYHVFREGESEELVKSIEGCQLLSVEKEQGNYVICLRKL